MSIQVITFNCILKNKTGKLISSTYNKDVLNALEDTTSSNLRGLVSGLQNVSSGEKRTLFIKAEDAYGLYDPKKIILYPRKKLPKTICLNETLILTGKSGKQRSYRVLQILEDLVRLDENHPLAGQDLIFEIETLAVRNATPEEIDDANNCCSSQRLH